MSVFFYKSVAQIKVGSTRGLEELEEKMNVFRYSGLFVKDNIFMKFFYDKTSKCFPRNEENLPVLQTSLSNLLAFVQTEFHLI